jgi:hypothetical protein
MLREQTLIAAGCEEEQLHLTGWHAVPSSGFIGLGSKAFDNPHTPFISPCMARMHTCTGLSMVGNYSIWMIRNSFGIIPVLIWYSNS